MRWKKPDPNCSTCRGIGYVSVIKDGYSNAKPCACIVPPKSPMQKRRELVIGKIVLDQILSRSK